jgi:hypothetical protein
MAEAIAEATELGLGRVTDVLDDLDRHGLARERRGGVSGWMPSSRGRDRHRQLLAGALPARDRRAAEVLYREFGPLNREVKEVCTDWQLRLGVPNDHADTGYDNLVVGRLRVLHDRADRWCAELEQHLPRAARYRRRLSAAVTAVEGGNRDRFTTPLADSYHDIWMELHQDLLVTLGLERTAADA